MRTGDPLASWNDGASKRAIVAFVTKVTTEGGADYLPTAQRIAVFDHDGTLWSEQPMNVQAMFTQDRVKLLAEQHPEWRQKQPFQSVLEGNLAGVALSGEKGVFEIVNGDAWWNDRRGIFGNRHCVAGKSSTSQAASTVRRMRLSADAGNVEISEIQRISNATS